MDIIERYLSKQSYHLYNPSWPDFDTEMVVVIPCYNEEHLLRSLDALRHSLQVHKAWVIVVINHSLLAQESIKQQNETTHKELLDYIADLEDSTSLYVSVITAYDIAVKDAGVGYARKVGMDSACAYFVEKKIDGYIICYDADTLCCDDYLDKLYPHFDTQPYTDAWSIHFEHPLDTTLYKEEEVEAIIQYESHLRYFIEMQRLVGLPFAYQTVGSSMAVRASSYAKYGGMNKRKAGEDFYFLQKIIANGKVATITDTWTIPSPRISDRVPFGTGKAVGDMVHSGQALTTYHPESFRILAPFIRQMPALYESLDIGSLGLDIRLIRYLEEEGIMILAADCKKRTKTYETFHKRFFANFDAFRLMKYVHWMRDHYLPNMYVGTAIEMGLGIQGSLLEMLLELRQREITNSYS